MAGAMEEAKHPVTFILFVTLAVFGTAHILTYVLKRAGMPGPAGFFQGH